MPLDHYSDHFVSEWYIELNSKHCFNGFDNFVHRKQSTFTGRYNPKN